MTIKEALNNAKKVLKEGQVSEPEASAEFLMRHILGVERANLYAILEQNISSKNLCFFEELVKRRKHHEPVWQITGKVPFWGRNFSVTKDVLVPRPETEMLVEAAIGEAKEMKSPRVLDVGTGSGPIIITLAREVNGNFFASDISEEALIVAKKNAEDLNASVDFRQGNLFDPWQGQKFDLICANLPYIPKEDLGGLALDLHHWEPRLALSGGPGGLVIYEQFLKELPQHLKPKAVVICEIGKDQGKDFCSLAHKYLPDYICEVKTDLAGIDRIVILRSL